MTYDHEAHWNRMNEAVQIWDEPQFTVLEVCKITGATAKALEHFLTPSRGMVRLMGSHVNPGTGKRRIFTGKQVLMIAAAYAMNKIGFPQRWSIALTDTVALRAINRSIGLSQGTEMNILTYPMQDGDWAVKTVYRETTETPRLPVAVQALDVDRLIDEVRAQLAAIITGEDIPDFTVPDVEPEPNPYSPKSNFFKMWTKDEAGNWLLVGLTLEETREYMTGRGMKLVGDDLEYFEAERDHRNLDRAVELDNKHEAARARVIGTAIGVAMDEAD